MDVKSVDRRQLMAVFQLMAPMSADR
jgi:hypothetical protein